MTAATEAQIRTVRSDFGAVDTREMLLTLARWEISERLSDHPDHCLAGIIRIAAPALAFEADDVVMARFGELCDDVAKLDGVISGSTAWCQVVDDPREDAEQAALSCLDDTLTKLTTPPGASS